MSKLLRKPKTMRSLTSHVGAFKTEHRVLILSLVLIIAQVPSSASANSRPITDLVPADCLVAYIARPYAAPQPTSQPVDITHASPGSSTIAAILALLDASGLIPDEGQVFADIASALPLLGRFEHSMVLLDVSSKMVRRPRGDDDKGQYRISLRLKSLQTAILFRTNGQHRAVLDQLNRIIGRYTNVDVAQLSVERLGGYKYQRLTDERLPGWAVWEWGRLDGFFVVSFGIGAFEKIATTYAGKRPSLTNDPWFKTATVKTQGGQAMAQCFLALARLEERLGEVAKGRHTRVIKALDADNMTHDLWTIGLQGRALTWYRCYRRNGEDITRHYSDPATYPPRHRQLVPAEARHYAIIRVPTRWLVDNLPRAWMAAQSERQVQTWRRVWQRLEQEIGIDIDGNLINHLGDGIVIFDYPPHPLKIPFALTIAIEIDDRHAVQIAVDAVLSAWGKYLDERATRKGTTWVRVRVHHDSDGVYYLQAGILGPALKVTDNYLVISWNPLALRDALRFIEEPRASTPDKSPAREI